MRLEVVHLERMGRSPALKRSYARKEQVDCQPQETNRCVHGEDGECVEVGPGHSLSAIPRRSPRFRGLKEEVVRVVLGEAGVRASRG